MSRAIARCAMLTALAAGAAWGQVTVSCTPATVPPLVGTVVSIACTASGGVGVYAWTISSGALPTGLTLDLLLGTITGTLMDPAGPYSFTVTATDVALSSGSQTFTGTTVDPLTISCVPATTGPVEVNVAYSATCTAGGGTPPYAWTLVGTAIPAGMTVTPTGNPAMVTVTPTAPLAAYHYHVHVADSTTPTALTADSPVYSGAIAPAVTIASPPTLPAATVGSAYSFTFTANPGVPSYTWSATGLPSWLTLSPAGVLGGTPPATGPVNFNVTVTDGAGGMSAGPFTLPVNAALTITTTSLPPDTINRPYNSSLTATGGTPPYTWSVSPPNGLPNGLSLNSTTGALTGTSSVSGKANFTVTVADSTPGTPATASLPLSITINPAPAVTTTSLPPGTIGTAYSASLTATGGTTPYTWSISPPNGLPNGLTLNTATGAITGPPTANGTSNFTVTVTDSSGATATQALSITITSALTITTTSLPAATAGTPYIATLTATGGTPPYSWSIITGTLPQVLTLDAASGAITGTPSGPGTSFTVQVKDSAAATATQPLSIVVNPTITTNSPLPGGTAGVPYSQTLTASGGVLPYTWSVKSGGLPGGLTLNAPSASSVMLSGTPNTSGTFTFTVQVNDSATGVGTKQFSLTIAGGLIITTAPTLPGGTVGTAYSQTLMAAGGTQPYTWSQTGSLPSGLSLSSTGVISGTPSAAGTATFTAKVADSGGATATKAFTITIVSALTVTTASPLPSGELGIAYSQTLAATGGAPPYTWSASVGTLPNGLSLSAGGLIGGTPNLAGTFTFTATVTDSASATASQAFTLTIAGPLGISTLGTLNGGSIGSSYSANLVATGGLSPYSWKVTSGNLPNGLTLSSSGSITGSPTATGTFLFTAQVTDAAGATAIRQFTISISLGLAISSSSPLPGGTIGTVYSYQLLAAGGAPPYTWNLSSGSVPGGLSLAASGLISGTPSATGTFIFIVRVIDSKAQSATSQVTLVVAPPLSITTTALPNGAVGAAYSQTLAATGGTPPYTWTLKTGALPTGLALSATGSITGKPSAAGTFIFTVQVTDSLSITATRPLGINVPVGLAISTAATLPPGSIGTNYSVTLAASGGAQPYSWVVSAGSSLPPGLSLSPAGVISGMPTTVGTFNFTVQVTDHVAATASQQFTLVIAGNLSITTGATLPGGKTGAPYSQTLAAAGGKQPYTWSVSSGTPPPGVALSPDGTLSGTPTTAGNYSFTVQVADSASHSASQHFTLAISSGLTITTALTLPAATAGTAYSQTLAVTGGTAPYTWSIVTGALPTGLTLDGASGTIGGTPKAAGNFTITFQAMDKNQLTGAGNFTLAVGIPAAPSSSLAGAPATATSAAQLQNIGLTLGSKYPIDITGQLTITFQPDAVNAADDPAIQFASGGRSASFTIAANSTAAGFQGGPPALQTGTIAGTIKLSVAWQAGGVSMPSGLSQSIQVARAAPVITNVTVSRASSSFTVTVTGYSNTREVTQALLQFTAASGQTLQTTSATVTLTDAANSWFQGGTSAQYGSQFILTLPFNVSNGSASAIGSVSVQLVNSVGTSSSTSGS